MIPRAVFLVINIYFRLFTSTYILVKEIVIESLIIGALSFNYIMTTSSFNNNLDTKVTYGYIGTGLVLGIVGVTFLLNLVYVWKSLKDLET